MDEQRRVWAVEFPERLIRLRKNKGWSQAELADAVGLHINQVKRYEKGTSQPTLSAIKRLTVALGVSADMLLFGSDEGGPDDELRVQFVAISKFDPDEKKVVRIVLEGLILKHEARRWGT
jgi:transcriptional regulator with XRE-family HTH domain